MNTTPQTLAPEVLRRILLGRRMLSACGSKLTAQSDALTVGQAILQAHAAAELVISAIAEHLAAERTERMTLMDYVSTAMKKTDHHFPGKGFFENLNRERVSFKHYGILPNPQEFHTVIARTYDHLEQACLEYLGVALGEVDVSELLQNDGVRESYRQARDLNEAGEFRQSLEILACALEEGVKGTGLQWSIRAGEPDPAVALELTAFGVDPGTYIGLQEFLPKIGIEGAILWDTRGKGHPGNWTYEKVSFCLETALDLLLKVQHAPFRPVAADFSMIFDDVLTAKQNGVLVHAELHRFYGVHHEFFGELKKGQQIRGRLRPAYRGVPGEQWHEVSSIEEANLFIIGRPRTDLPREVPKHHVLLVQANDVDLSYEPNAAAKEFFPHLFPADEAKD